MKLTAEKDFLTPDDVAGVIGCSAQSIRIQAREDPRMLGFPICVIGTRTYIPREGFIRWLKHGNAPVLEEK